MYFNPDICKQGFIYKDMPNKQQQQETKKKKMNSCSQNLNKSNL